MRIDHSAFAADKVASVTDYAFCNCAAHRGKSLLAEIAFGPIDSIPDVAPSGVTIVPGNTANGTLNPAGDVDVLGINVVAGQTYLVSLRGTGVNPVSDTVVSLYDADGNFLDYDDDGGAGLNSLLTFTAAYSGFYYVAAESFSVPPQAGTYSLDVRVAGADAVTDQFATATAITTSTTFGFIETSNDIDTYKFEVKAGFFYSIELAGGADYEYSFRDLFAGELDTILALYGPDGSFISFNDDISFPDDISSRLGFLATQSGTYYLDVLAYPNQVGGYTLNVEGVDPATVNPLDSIDWGTRLENPDGTVDRDVTVYFAKANEVFGGRTSLGWNQIEIDATMASLQTYENILGIDVRVVDTAADADFKLVVLNTNQFLGAFFPPGTGPNEGVGFFARNGTGWSETVAANGGLQQGGYGFITLIHEFGHGFGLSHPHDNGGGSSVMLGVTGPFDSLGIYDLNQGVYTTMSYNDGWFTHPDARPDGFPVGASIAWGWQGTPSAFDVKLLQDKYGANTTYNNGANVYVLPTANVAGTFYTTIWDTGGVDTIVQEGTVAARIDLTAATLDYSPTGGGVVSFVDGVYGGFTIANGVVIENATGGAGDDVLIGNAAANRLTGNAGDDFLLGGKGGDVIDGGIGFDTVSYRTSETRVKVNLQGSADEGDARGDRLIGIEAIEGSNHDDVLGGSNAGDRLIGLGGKDLIEAGNGNDTLDGGEGNDTLKGDNGVDDLSGGNGNDRLEAGNGDDIIFGGAGDDRLKGDGGRDQFIFDADSYGRDVIEDYKRGEDKIVFKELTSANIDVRGNRIFVDLDGDGAFNDLTITVQGDSLRATDIVFG